MIIYALSNDFDDHQLEGGRTVPRSHSSGSPDDVQTINVMRSYTIEWLANDIKNRVDTFRSETGRPGTKIRFLRISSHGNAGRMSIGRGLDRETAEQFRVLADGYFAGDGQGIELWGCSVASAEELNPPPFDADSDDNGTLDGWSPEGLVRYGNYQTALGQVTRTRGLRRGSLYPSILRGSRDRSGSVEEGIGYRMMAALARAANTKVTAAYDIQIPEVDGLDWEWEGTGLLTVSPDGTSDITSLG